MIATTRHFAFDFAERRMPGEQVSGDLCRVREFDEGILAVVVDGIGHGREAHEAALAVASVIETMPRPQPLTAVLAACHESARRTRGVVMSVAWLPRTHPEMEWVSIGNVDGVVRRADKGSRERLLTLGGIVGGRMRRALPRAVPMSMGDVVVLATDGAPGAVEDETFDLSLPPAVLARLLVDRHATARDDALVFVGVYRGMVDVQ